MAVGWLIAIRACVGLCKLGLRAMDADGRLAVYQLVPLTSVLL